MSITNGLAPTPPMGWNSYDYFGGQVNEEDVLANANYLARHLRHVGWEYVVIDIAWHTFDHMNDFTADEVDPHGRLLPSLRRFPSARGGVGFRPLADRIHDMGLKFGIHVMPGVCRRAIDAGLTVESLGTPLRDIVLPDEFNALWPGALHYLRPHHPGAQAYYDSIMRLYASWGVDFIKADGPGYPYRPAEIEMLDLARRRAGRPMVLSISAGCTQHAAYMNHRKAHCEMSRISEDFWDRFPMLEQQFANFTAWRDHVGPGHWPDGDMLPLGRIGKLHPNENGPARHTRFTPDEQRTLMTLWCTAQSPLFLGGDLPANTADDLALLNNPEVIEVNQFGRNGRELFRDCHFSAVVWIAELPAKNEWALAVFNFHPHLTRRIGVLRGETGIPTGCVVRDAWSRRELGAFADSLDVDIPPHGAGLYRVRRRG